MRNTLRDLAIREVKQRVFDACLLQSQLEGGLPLDVLVNDTLHYEQQRIENDVDPRRRQDDLVFWKKIKKRLGRASQEESARLLESIISRFSDEIQGHFSPALYGLATRGLPKAFPLMLNAMSPKRIFRGDFPAMSETIQLQGQIEAMKRLSEKGTLILAPTHSSNLDSPLMGWAIYALGLPPFAYGAGLNLFSNPMLSFFMRHLGAYRVDRSKISPLYKDILKTYATVSLELGQSNLFFPGGTRSRSGAVESHLKLGLLSAGLRALTHNLAEKKERPKIFIVPATINYRLVLEAQTLIEEQLRRQGQERYIDTVDESFQWMKVLEFLKNAARLDTKVVVEFGEAIDPFGNKVDSETGDSLDLHGRPIELSHYLTNRKGEIVQLPQRDRVYTQEAGKALVSAYKRHTVLLATQILAFLVWESWVAKAPEVDLYRRLRDGDEGLGMPIKEVVRRASFLAEEIEKRVEEGQVQREALVSEKDGGRLLQEALRHFGSYHQRKVLERRGDRVYCRDPKLLYFYSNRLRGYGLEKPFHDYLKKEEGL